MHIDLTTVLVALITLCGSAGMWTLIDHGQQRKADQKMHDSELMQEIKSIHKEIDGIRDTIELNEAKSRRVRILKFADEVFMDMNHSKDSFDQVLSDITDYDNYCAEHPEFKNHQTAETVEYIKKVYDKRLEKKDFARYWAGGDDV